MTATEREATRRTYAAALAEAIRDAWATRHSLPEWSAMQLRLARRYRALLREAS